MGTHQYARRALLGVAGAAVATLALAACGQAAGGAAANTAATTDQADQAVSSAASSTSEHVSTAASTATSATSAATSTAVPTTTTASATTTQTASAAATSAVSTGAAASDAGSATATAITASGNAAGAATASAPAAGQGVKLTLDPSGTVASYQVQEQLAGHDFPSQAEGKTSAVSGAIVLDASGKLVTSASKIALDLRTLKSDQGMRDNYIQHDPLDTTEYPTATFVPSATSGLPWPLPASGTAKFDLVGDMTVHGTTKPMTWAVTATFAPDKVTGEATTPFTFTEFGMQPPHTMIALSVHDGGTLNLQFTAVRTAQ